MGEEVEEEKDTQEEQDTPVTVPGDAVNRVAKVRGARRSRPPRLSAPSTSSSSSKTWRPITTSTAASWDDHHVYFGVIKSFAEKVGWGFVQCDETFRRFGKDVFLLRSASGLRYPDTFKIVEGRKVAFRIKFPPSQGDKPMAVDLEFVDL